MADNIVYFSVPAVVGIAVGGAALIFVVILLGFLIYRRTRAIKAKHIQKALRARRADSIEGGQQTTVDGRSPARGRKVSVPDYLSYGSQETLVSAKLQKKPSKSSRKGSNSVVNEKGSFDFDLPQPGATSTNRGKSMESSRTATTLHTIVEQNNEESSPPPVPELDLNSNVVAAASSSAEVNATPTVLRQRASTISGMRSGRVSNRTSATKSEAGSLHSRQSSDAGNEKSTTRARRSLSFSASPVSEAPLGPLPPLPASASEAIRNSQDVPYRTSGTPSFTQTPRSASRLSNQTPRTGSSIRYSTQPVQSARRSSNQSTQTVIRTSKDQFQESHLRAALSEAQKIEPIVVDGIPPIPRNESSLTEVAPAPVDFSAALKSNKSPSKKPRSNGTFLIYTDETATKQEASPKRSPNRRPLKELSNAKNSPRTLLAQTQDPLVRAGSMRQTRSIVSKFSTDAMSDPFAASASPRPAAASSGKRLSFLAPSPKKSGPVGAERSQKSATPTKPDWRKQTSPYKKRVSLLVARKRHSAEIREDSEKRLSGFGKNLSAFMQELSRSKSSRASSGPDARGLNITFPKPERRKLRPLVLSTHDSYDADTSRASTPVPIVSPTPPVLDEIDQKPVSPFATLFRSSLEAHKGLDLPNGTGHKAEDTLEDLGFDDPQKVVAAEDVKSGRSSPSLSIVEAESSKKEFEEFKEVIRSRLAQISEANAQRLRSATVSGRESVRQSVPQRQKTVHTTDHTRFVARPYHQNRRRTPPAQNTPPSYQKNRRTFTRESTIAHPRTPRRASISDSVRSSMTIDSVNFDESNAYRARRSGSRSSFMVSKSVTLKKRSKKSSGSSSGSASFLVDLDNELQSGRSSRPPSGAILSRSHRASVNLEAGNGKQTTPSMPAFGSLMDIHPALRGPLNKPRSPKTEVAPSIVSTVPEIQTTQPSGLQSHATSTNQSAQQWRWQPEMSSQNHIAGQIRQYTSAGALYNDFMAMESPKQQRRRQQLFGNENLRAFPAYPTPPRPHYANQYTPTPPAPMLEHGSHSFRSSPLTPTQAFSLDQTFHYSPHYRYQYQYPAHLNNHNHTEPFPDADPAGPNELDLSFPDSSDAIGLARDEEYAYADAKTNRVSGSGAGPHSDGSRAEDVERLWGRPRQGHAVSYDQRPREDYSYGGGMDGRYALGYPSQGEGAHVNAHVNMNGYQGVPV